MSVSHARSYPNFRSITLVAGASVALQLWGLTMTSPLYAQECVDDRVAIEWTQPPRVPIEDDSSLRWPVEGSMKVAYTGSWCPSADQISFTDVDGAELPALLMTRSADQLVENGPLGVNLLIVKPLMSLAERTDYTLRLEPPNPRLREFAEVELSFKTHNQALAEIGEFKGLKEVSLEAACGEGYTDINAEDFECVIPSHFNLSLTFKPLPNPEVTYAIYRVSSTAFDAEGQAIMGEVDNEERLVSFVPGVTEEASERSITTMVSSLYAPLPREECYRVEVWDERGRSRAETEAKCLTLTQPVGCPVGCDPEAGDCTFIFATPEPFSVNEPIVGASCDRQGLYDADPETEIPPLPSGEPEPEPEPEMEAGEASETGCHMGHHGAHPALIWGSVLLIALLILRRKLRI